jgi:hypothetical protein
MKPDELSEACPLGAVRYLKFETRRFEHEIVDMSKSKSVQLPTLFIYRGDKSPKEHEHETTLVPGNDFTHSSIAAHVLNLYRNDPSTPQILVYH